jgi:1-acyl-sn-glycerol-3-phosphate acyltransferase
MKIIRTIYSFAVVGLMAVSLSVIGLVLFLFRLTGLRKIADALMYKLVYWVGWIIIVCTGCKFTIIGRENIPQGDKRGLCFVCNHSGYFDILLLFASAGRPLGFIAKKEIGYVPFINIILLMLGGIFMDRSSPRKSLESINKGVKHLNAGHSMAIFPEGTRSKGRGLLPFRTGAFRLATAAGAPIIPVALTGSYEVFEKTGLVIPGEVFISYGPPIETAQLEENKKKQWLSDQVHAAIEKMLY